MLRVLLAEAIGFDPYTDRARHASLASQFLCSASDVRTHAFGELTHLVDGRAEAARCDDLLLVGCILLKFKARHALKLTHSTFQHDGILPSNHRGIHGTQLLNAAHALTDKLLFQLRADTPDVANADFGQRGGEPLRG